MKDALGTTGLVLNEPLLWEKGRNGRLGFSLPNRDVPRFTLNESIRGDGPDFPDLSEVDVIVTDDGLDGPTRRWLESLKAKLIVAATTEESP